MNFLQIIDSWVAVSRITKVRRIEEIEAMLIGQSLADLDIESIVSKLKDSVKIASDYRSSKEYRRQLLGALFKRMLQNLQEEKQ